MRATYSPEIGLVLRFEGSEVQEGCTVLEEICDKYDENGVDTSELRRMIFGVRNVNTSVH